VRRNGISVVIVVINTALKMLIQVRHSCQQPLTRQQ
jgi:hypothetical protein